MSTPLRHIVHQGPMIRSLGRMAVAALRQRAGGNGHAAGPADVPGPELTEVVPPRDPELVRDYVRWAGGDPKAYGRRLPPHLWPQWGFPLLGRALAGVGYPLSRVLNGGSRIEVHAPLPVDQPLYLRGRLAAVDDDGRRAVLTLRLVTGTAEMPDAVVSDLVAFVPLSKADGRKDKSAKRRAALVPDDAREIGRWKLPPDAGLAFACLTGDFNPVHWLPPYAKAAGFRSTILHGFATEARAIETLNRVVFAGDTRRLQTVDVKFTRPVQLPARVGCYVRDGEIYVGDAPGGPAYLTGTFASTLAAD